MEDGSVVEESDTETTFKTVRAFALCAKEGKEEEEDLKWPFNVSVLNVGIQSFSTRMGVSLNELFDLIGT
jgi:hypothetical protein